MESLTQKVLQYQRTRQGLPEIVRELAPRVYQFPRWRMGYDEDACGDFYVFIHPRLIRLIDRFRDQGKPFESYLWAVLSWQLRNFARDRARAGRAWSATLRLDPPEEPGPAAAAADEGGIDMGALVSGFGRCVRSDADRRNFLFLALKCARMIDQENAPGLAAIAGVAPAELLAHACTLRDMGSSRERRLETFRCRRNRAFAQARLLEVELRNETDEDRRQILAASLDRMRRRMGAAVRRMSRVGMAPTNLEIARVLAVPKGTVDSGLYWLKKKLAMVYDPETLRSA
jgi:DNA-directed RNA polymerase specialized sigma24 family protein